jgi:hypothetical protein
MISNPRLRREFCHDLRTIRRHHQTGELDLPFFEVSGVLQDPVKGDQNLERVTGFVGLVLFENDVTADCRNAGSDLIRVSFQLT